MLQNHEGTTLITKAAAAQPTTPYGGSTYQIKHTHRKPLQVTAYTPGTANHTNPKRICLQHHMHASIHPQSVKGIFTSQFSQTSWSSQPNYPMQAPTNLPQPPTLHTPMKPGHGANATRAPKTYACRHARHLPLQPAGGHTLAYRPTRHPMVCGGCVQCTSTQPMHHHSAYTATASGEGAAESPPCC